MNKKRNEMGITMVALVITIVVLLILAGVSINLVLGNNGIIAKAKEAKETYGLSSKKEKIGMAVQACMINDSKEIKLDDLKESIKNQVPDAVIDGNNFPVIVDLGSEKVSIDKSGNVKTCGKSVKLKIDNKEQEITEKNVADYYGREVENYTQNDTKYRLFYIDFEGKYGDAGTSYIIADSIVKSDKLSSYKTYEAINNSVMKKLNPQWSTSDGVIDNKNENIVSWICNPKEWSVYANENANYAVGGPSMEMYVDSYRQAMNMTSYKTRVTQFGYEFSPDNEKNWYQSAQNRFTEDNNGIYLTNDGDFWLSSMSAGNENCIYAASLNAQGIVSNGYGQEAGFRPVVSVKSSFKLELK